MRLLYLICGICIAFFSCDFGTTEDAERLDSISDPSIDDVSKRNEDWGWVVDSTGKGVWIPTGDLKPTFSGNYTVFYSTGEVYETGFIRNGVHQDTSIVFDKNGKELKYVIYTTDSAGISYYINDGPYVQAFQNGKLKLQGTIKEHKLQGVFSQYNSSGILIFESNVIDGTGWKKGYFPSGVRKDSANYIGEKQNGILYIWYENGQVSQITNWKDNVQYGHQLYYYDNGQLQREDFWENGDVHGPLKIYHRNGTLQHDHTYVFGKRDGLVRAYHENGALKVEGHSKNGVNIGKWYYYDESGKLIEVDTYENGELVNTEVK